MENYMLGVMCIGRVGEEDTLIIDMTWALIGNGRD